MTTVDLTADPDVTIRLVVLEFGGLGAEQTFARAIRERPALHLTVVDPLTRDGANAAVSLSRIGEDKNAIIAAGPPRVVVVAACTGVVDLAPLAYSLQALGVDIVRVIAVDPQIPTADFVAATLARLGENLGLGADAVNADAQAVTAEPDLDSPVRRARALTTRAFREFLAANAVDDDERDMYIGYVLPRYIACVSFLLSALHRSAVASLGEIHNVVGYTSRGLDGICGQGCVVVERQVDAEGGLVLTDDQACAELCTVLAEVDWVMPA